MPRRGAARCSCCGAVHHVMRLRLPLDCLIRSTRAAAPAAAPAAAAAAAPSSPAPSVACYPSLIFCALFTLATNHTRHGRAAIQAGGGAGTGQGHACGRAGGWRNARDHGPARPSPPRGSMPTSRSPSASSPPPPASSQPQASGPNDSTHSSCRRGIQRWVQRWVHGVLARDGRRLHGCAVMDGTTAARQASGVSCRLAEHALKAPSGGSPPWPSSPAAAAPRWTPWAGGAPGGRQGAVGAAQEGGWLPSTGAQAARVRACLQAALLRAARRPAWAALRHSCPCAPRPPPGAAWTLRWPPPRG